MEKSESETIENYNWLMVLLMNTGVVLLTIFIYAIRNDLPSATPAVLIALGVSLTATISPILIAQSKNKNKAIFGYGIPLLFLVATGYFIYDMLTCTGKFCSLWPLLLSWTLGLCAVVFVVFYIVGAHSNNWGEKRVRLLSFLIPTIFIGSLFSLLVFSSV